MVTSSELIKIKKQFSANLRAVDRMKKRLEIIDSENKAMMKLISEVEEDTSFQDISVAKAISKRNSQFNIK